MMHSLLKVLTRLPLPVMYGVGFLMYFVVFHLMRWRRDRAKDDIANAFPEMSPKERATILKDSYRNLADAVMESFWGFGASTDAIKERVTIEDPELIQRAIDRNQTLVLLAAHHGNWEWLLLAAGAHFAIPIDVVYQPQRIAALDTFLRDGRRRFGGKLIPRKEFIYALLSHNPDHPRAYALIADQTPRRQDPKYWTRFLRQDTAFFLGAGKVAKYLEAPVYFVSMRRTRRGHYTVKLEVLAEPPYEELDDALIVENYARKLERAIIESPADWLWLQKKWKYAKPEPGEDTLAPGMQAR